MNKLIKKPVIFPLSSYNFPFRFENNIKNLINQTIHCGGLSDYQNQFPHCHN
jgi:hypothetical protein